MKALVLMLKQDDPFKCTASKLVKFGLAQPVRYFCRDNLVLNPFAETLLSRQDLKISSSICAIDCSWQRARNILRQRHFSFHRIGRRLPLLLAANPTNYSKAGLLSTAEALAGSLYILGYRDMAEEFMNKFKWGHTFLELNCNLLEDYANVENPEQIAELEEEYFPQLS
jgi:pre-rRNA-processing protein TSR3